MTIKIMPSIERISSNGKCIVERPEKNEKPQYFSVYIKQKDGCDSWLADFMYDAHAMLFRDALEQAVKESRERNNEVNKISQNTKRLKGHGEVVRVEKTDEEIIAAVTEEMADTLGGVK